MEPFRQRIELVDTARGVALVAMTVFHFAFDLELFGFQERGFISQPHWKYFARSIASSFLFLTGFSLYLSHHSEMIWPKWSWRMGKIIGAAMIITIATYFATPDQFIFFGILHQIAFASLVGLLFVQLPALLTLAIAIAVFVAGQTLEFQALDHPAWWWTGLSSVSPVSSDYVPVFPWLSASLAGIATAKICHAKGMLNTLANIEFQATSGRALQFLGRHSLVYYLVHQPIMIAAILAFMLATGRASF